MTPRISLVAVCCSSASVELLEQPHVLDRDDRLIGEGFEQLDLLFGEKANFCIRRMMNCSNGLPSRSSGAASTVRTPRHLACRDLAPWKSSASAAEVVNMNRLPSVDHRL